jgi:hypothetical protein
VKTFFGFDLTIDQILSTQESGIKHSLLWHERTYEEQRAVEIFKKLVSLMKEDFQLKHSHYLTDMLKECISSTESFCDEIYLQLIKLLRGNKKPVRTIRVLQVLSVLVYMTLPSQYLSMAILNYIMCQQALTKNAEEDQLYRYIFVRMLRRLKHSERKWNVIPPSYQIVSIMAQRQIWVPVFICTGGTILVWADSFETVEQVKVKALEKMGINIKRVPLNFFGMFEIVNKQNELCESMLQPTASIWNLLGKWEDERAFSLRLKNKDSLPVFILMLKIVYPYEYQPEDFLSQQLVFSQTFYDLFTGRF